MQTVVSKDGTRIAYDKEGQGPAVILVAGAMCARLSWSGPALSELLAPHFTVYNYDRRGRGDSGDTLPYAVEREVEDIQALIDEAGGSAYLYGHSSGACLALEAALRLDDKVKKLAMYEAPYNSEATARKAWAEYRKDLGEILAKGHKGDAVARFMKIVGLPDGQIEGMRHAPTWPQLEALAPTLVYDAAVIGQDASVPVERVASIQVSTLVMNGDASFPFMFDAAEALSKAIKHSELVTLKDETHDARTEVLSPILSKFFQAAPLI